LYINLYDKQIYRNLLIMVHNNIRRTYIYIVGIYVILLLSMLIHNYCISRDNIMVDNIILLFITYYYMYVITGTYD